MTDNAEKRNQDSCEMPHDDSVIADCKCQHAPKVGVEMTWKEIAYALWKLLDDIDTVSDVAKGNDAVYRKYVERLHTRRCLYLESSDGMTLTPVVKIDEPNDVGQAVEVISQALHNDPELRQGWHDNIAMTICDHAMHNMLPEERNRYATALLAHLFSA